MKSNLLKTALLAVSMLGAASSAFAETVHAKIPFEFTANGKVMPAGDYTVRTMSGTSPVLVFENDLTKVQAIAFARAADSAASKSVAALIVKTAGMTYEVSMSVPTSSMKGAVLALTPGK